MNWICQFLLLGITFKSELWLLKSIRDVSRIPNRPSLVVLPIYYVLLSVRCHICHLHYVSLWFFLALFKLSSRLYPVRSFRHFETEPFNFIKVMCLVMILLLRSLTCDTWYCNAYQALICGGLGNVNFAYPHFHLNFPRNWIMLLHKYLVRLTIFL